MDVNTLNAILTFAAALLIFLAALVPIVWSIWRRAVSENRHQRLIATVLNVLSVLISICAVVARFAFHWYAAAVICLAINILLITWMFIQRPFEMSRAEVGSTILTIALTCYLLSSWTEEGLRQKPPTQTAPAATPPAQ